MTPAMMWASKLRGEAESRMADCCLDGMTPEEQRESINDMLLDFCHDRGVPTEIVGDVASLLNSVR